MLSTRETTAGTPRLSIVIPTYNGRHVLAECLSSVQRYRPADSEVIVVDDCSTDGTANWLRQTHPDVRLVRLDKNRGFCGAINAGIRVARAPIVETLNNDTVVTENWVEGALRLFEDASVGSVAPLVWLYDQDGLIDSAGDTYHLCGWARNRNHKDVLSDELLHVTEVFGASASAAFFRREALVRAGLFPEAFGAYFDDVDVAFRLRWAGFRCLFTPHTQVFHRLHQSYKHSNPKLLRQVFLNEERVFWMNLPDHLLAHALLPHALHVLCNALGRWIGNENPGAYLFGKLAVLRERARILQERQARYALAMQARYPVAFPVSSDWATVVHNLLKRFRGLLPGFVFGRPHVQPPSASAMPAVRREESKRAAA